MKNVWIILAIILTVIGIGLIVMGIVTYHINCDERFPDCVDDGYSEVYCGGMVF
jgi:uncharacterized membrane protein